jgi:molybdate transport system ATP-binding protein
MFWLKAAAMLRVQFSKKRREFTVQVSFELDQGCSLGLFGASGTGKSTVLGCIAGLEDPDDGCIRLGDLRIFPPSLPLHRRPLGYLTQEPHLFPHLTVRENVMFGISGNHAAGSEQLQWISTLRDRLRLAPLWEAPAARVSGGQGRRVALARVLARKPPLLLLDEPFAGLDRRLVRELIEDLAIWRQMLGFSIIAVDHQAEMLKRLCPERAIVLEAGHAVQQGTWEDLYQSPATPALRSLLLPL